MEFKGRVILGGDAELEAVVTREGFNTLASCQKSAMGKKDKIICSDQNNRDIYNKNITGKALCLPKTIGSTTGGMVLQTVAHMGIAPAAMLFAEPIDSLAASGVLLADIWNNHRIITIDNLGIDFLTAVETGKTVTIKNDGTVTIEEK